MGGLRNHFRRLDWLALLLVAGVLLARVAIPAGFMPVATGAGVTFQLCTGMGPAQVAIAIPGKTGLSSDLAGRDDGPHKRAPAESTCAFAGMNAPAMAGADPVVLALAVLFAMALGWRAAMAAALPTIRNLRPPLRGPPAGA